MFNISSKIILGCKLSLAKLPSHFIIFLVHCQSVNTENPTVNGIEGKPAVFQWTVNGGTFIVGSVLIFHGTDFNSSRLLVSLDIQAQRLKPTRLAESLFKGRLNATISGDVMKDSKFNCTLTLHDLRLSDRDQNFFLYASFIRGGDTGKVTTLVDVRGIYCFVLFYFENFYLFPFLRLHIRFMYFTLKRVCWQPCRLWLTMAASYASFI